MTPISFRLAALGLLVAGAASAQTDSLSGVGSNVNLFSAGPYTYDQLSLDPATDEPYGLTLGDVRFLPRIEAMGIYEENPLTTSGEQSVDDNAYFLVSPGAMLRLGTPAGNYAYLDYTADFAAGDDVGDKTVAGQRATALAHYTTGRTTMDTFYRFRDVSAGDTNVGERLDKQEHAAYGSLEHRTSEKTALGAGVNYTRHNFDDSAFVDFAELRLSGRAHYKATSKTRVYLEGAYGQVDLDGRTDSYGDANYAEANLGASSRIDTQWTLDCRVGNQWRTFDDAGLKDVNSVVAMANLRGTLVERVQAGVKFWSMVQPTVNEAGGTLTERRIEPSIGRHLFTEDLMLFATLVWGWVDYETPDTQAAVGEIGTAQVYDGREDSYFGYTLSADWQASRTMKIGLAYSYLDQNSDEVPGVDSRDYTTERYMLRGQYNF